MSKGDRRKQRKAKKAAQTARRQAKAAAKAVAPKFDFSLPTTRVEIEAAIEAVTSKILTEGPASVEHTESGKIITLTPSQAKLMRLQKQLFRAVFGREPSPNDPIFWDRGHEHEGVFRIDPEEDNRQFSKVLAEADIRPEIAYAMALTGMTLTRETEHLHSDEDIEEWNEAIDDYIHQASTGVPPLTPVDFFSALGVVNDVASQANVIPIGLAGYPNTTENRMIIALKNELGNTDKAAAAMSRMAALVRVADLEEFKHLVSPEGYRESAVRAASSAEVDMKTGLFNLDSFRDKLGAVSEESSV